LYRNGWLGWAGQSMDWQISFARDRFFLSTLPGNQLYSVLMYNKYHHCNYVCNESQLSLEPIRIISDCQSRVIPFFLALLAAPSQFPLLHLFIAAAAVSILSLYSSPLNSASRSSQYSHTILLFTDRYALSLHCRILRLTLMDDKRIGLWSTLSFRKCERQLR
jgi:hypothetical protein